MKFLTRSVVLMVFLLMPLDTFAASPDADVSSGATGSSVSVTSAVAGTRVGPEAIRTALRVRVKEGAAVPVCFNYVDRGLSCATALTTPDSAGFCAGAGNGYIFMVEDEHFRGQVCAILQSGSTAVTVPYNSW